jgi:hypothetical protein
MEGNTTEQLIAENKVDFSRFYLTPAFERFMDEATANKAEKFFDLMKERNSRLFALHAGYRNGGKFVFHAGAIEAYYFILNLEPKRMEDKIIEAGSIIKGKPDIAIDAGDLVYLFGPILAAELVNEFGTEKIKEHLEEIVFKKRSGSTVEEIKEILKN